MDPSNLKNNLLGNNNQDEIERIFKEFREKLQKLNAELQSENERENDRHLSDLKYYEEIIAKQKEKEEQQEKK